MISKSTITISSIKYGETPRGVAYTASLLLNGEKVGTINNDGIGGDTYYHGKHNAILQYEAKVAGYTVMEHYFEHLMDVAEGVTDTKRQP